MFGSESAVEYFKGLVDDALARQHIAAGEPTACYVVHLLASFLRRRTDQDEPLVFRLAQALEAAGSQQRASLRQIGDLSLFVAGFFPDSFHRKPIDLDYYVSIGGTAYGALSRYETDTLSSVFAELADKFVLGFVSCRKSASGRRAPPAWIC